MQQCCDASVDEPRQPLDQLFIRIEKVFLLPFEHLRPDAAIILAANHACGQLY